MASIGSILPTSTTSAATGSTTSASTSTSNSLASQQTFLQLLVAQLKNQDPTQPVQGTEFVTQLATFTNVQENLGVEQDVDALSNKTLGYVPSGNPVAAVPTTATTGTGTTTSASGG